MQRTVTVIPQTKNLHTHMSIDKPIKRKVAAYARVSTDSEEQLTSYEAQVDYYTKMINSKPEWSFVNVYTDEGISAVMTKHRDGFNQMVQDALDGKIDLIVTKSVSRFARNTVDSLVTVRQLKDKGVEVYFEKENIFTLDSKGELLITIMSSLAQEESRSISENVTWGQRKRFADGKISLPYNSFLGYKKGKNGLPEIVPKEAETVRLIYKLFIQGKTVNSIAKHLMAEGIPSPTGKEKWQTSTVESILKNEKYKGSALLQKKFTINFLSKKMKVNEGEVPQYYIEHSHEAIISPDEWELVQKELNARKSKGKHNNSLSPFSAKIICGECGSYYGSKVWHSNTKYRRTIWQCNSKFKGDKICATPHLYEADIKRLFLRAFSKLLNDRMTLIDDCRLIYDKLSDVKEIDERSKTLLEDMEVVSELVKRLISENASTTMEQAQYCEKYDSYTKRFDKAKSEYDRLQKTREEQLYKAEVLSGFMFEIQEIEELPLEFDEKLWNSVIDKVIVNEDETVVFKFKNGAEITELL
ncbi:MAG: recombinase family protein [Clostridia bacterium]|nr:recombinase family protein [Clostridia bacterium]